MTQDYKLTMILSEENIQKIKNSTFLVTGGAGFIGSHIVATLLQNGAKHVRVLDNLSTGSEANIVPFLSHPDFEFIKEDIRDTKVCDEACEGRCYIAHQAALGSVPRSIDDPQTTNDVNISGHLNILVAAKNNSVKRVVYAASSSTYGDSKELPKIEHRIGKPLSPYAVTKYVNELYADVFATTYGLESIGLRYFNVFGPRQNPLGQYAAVIPLFIDAVINKKNAFINGDGSQTRDFTYVDNVVQANILAMLTDNADAVNQVYNIAFGERTSVNELFFSIKAIAGSDCADPVYRNSRQGDINDSLADIGKAKTLLNYQPEVSIREGLKRTVDYWMQH